MIVPIPNNIHSYQSSYPAMLRAVLAKRDVVKQLARERQHKVRAIGDLRIWERRYQTLAEAIREQHGKISLDSRDFQNLGGQLAPCLKLIPELHEPVLPDLASRILAESSADIAEVLQGSEFTKGDRRFRTDFRNGKAVVFGEDGQSILHLANIAHEVGHCLYERSLHDGEVNFVLESERNAYSLEYSQSKLFLDECNQQIFEAYWTTKSKLDYYFFFLEADELNLLELKDFCKQGANFFAPEYVFLRETYFTAVHYQYVYATCGLYADAS